MSSDLVKVLYIVGGGRSGSTILDNLLGQIAGFFSVGELHYLWSRGFRDNRLCGCGRPIPECPFWSVIHDRVVPAGVTIEEIIEWQENTVLERHTPRLILRRDAPLTHEERRFAELTGAVYRAIADVSGARVVVDSSKRPSDAAFLRLLSNIDPFFVHLTRDPRAVAYSWHRLKEQPDSDSLDAMQTQGPALTGFRWATKHALAELLRRRVEHDAWLLVRYEDFVERPRETLEDIVRVAGEPIGELPLRDEREAVLGVNHTVSGNPDRFKTGSVRLRSDDEWIRSQRRGDSLLASLAPLPLLGRYGYPMRHPKERAS